MTLNINNDFRSIVDHEADKFDPLSRAVTTIEHEHRLSHIGLIWHSSDRATVANAASLDLLLTVPAFTYPHFRKAIFNLGDGPCDIKMYEGVTTSAAGTASPVFNRNRNSANTPNTVLTTGPTVTDLGTLIHDRFVGDPGGMGANQVGSLSAGLGEEWVLTPSTKYLVRITNNSGGDITVNYEIMWYEIRWQDAGK